MRSILPLFSQNSEDLRASIQLDNRDYQLLSSLAKNRVCDFDMRNLTMSVLWALGTLRLRDEQLIDALCGRIKERIEDSDTRVENIVRGVLIPLDRLEYFPSDILDHSVQYVRSRIYLLDRRDLIQGVLNVAANRFGNKHPFFNEGCKELEKQSVVSFPTRDLAAYFYHLNDNQAKRYQEVSAELMKRDLAELKATSLALDIILPCHAQGNTCLLDKAWEALMSRPGDDLSLKNWICLLDVRKHVKDIAAKILSFDLEKAKSEHVLSALLHKLATLRYRDDALFSTIGTILIDRGLSRLDSLKLFGEFLWSFTEIGFYRATVFHAIHEECKRRGISTIQPRDLSLIIRSYAVFGLPYPEEYVNELYKKEKEWDEQVRRSFAQSLMAYGKDVSHLYCQAMSIRSSRLQQDVKEDLERAGLEVQEEYMIQGTSYDLFVRDPLMKKSMIVSVDGPLHFTHDHQPLARTLLRDRIAARTPFDYRTIRYFSFVEDIRALLASLGRRPPDRISNREIEGVSRESAKRRRTS